MVFERLSEGGAGGLKKGIIMEMNDSYLTLLTPDGEFLRAQKQDIPYSIGEEIYFFPVEDMIRRNREFRLINIFKLKALWVSAAAILILLGSAIPIYQSNQAYAYMSFDTDSNIELGLNKKMQVVEITGFSEEAEKIISNLRDWKKKDASEITPIILAKLEKAGFINQAEPVVITTIKTKTLAAEVETRLEKNIEEIKQSVDYEQLEVNMYTTTEEDIAKAHDSGIPVGKNYKGKNKSAHKKHSNNNNKSEASQSENNQSQSSVSAEQAPAESHFPPGQVKKQTENNSVQMETPAGGKVITEDQTLKSNQIAPEQQKKSQGQQKKNQGQVKQNNGLMKQSEKNQPNKQNKRENK